MSANAEISKVVLEKTREKLQEFISVLENRLYEFYSVRGLEKEVDAIQDIIVELNKAMEQ